MFDGYIRVSQVGGRGGDRFISPDVQREQIHAWAAAHGVFLGEVFEELDESGARKDRPLLMQAIGRIEAGASDGIVVARLDRFGRSLLDGLAAIERIVNANGTFVSAQDGLDLRTDTGKLILRVMLSMAEWELDRIRTTWDAARERAIRRGVHLGRTAPFGYQRGRNGQLEVNTQTGPILQELFVRRADGESIPGLARWLEGGGVITAGGNRGWTDTSLRNILRNRVYLGELRSGKYLSRDTHSPLVERGLWQRAQTPRDFPIQRNRKPTLLGGILRCAACRFVLHSGTVQQKSGRRSAAYACHGRSSQGQCPSPAHVSGPLIEPFVEEVFFGALTHRLRPKATDHLRENAAIDAAETALDAYRDNSRIQAALGEDRYLEGLLVRKRRLERAMQALAVIQQRAEPLDVPSVDVLEDLWPTLSTKERRDMFAKVVDCVFVRRGWGGVMDRAFVCYRGHQPMDLPRPGVRRGGEAIRPFDPAEVGRQAKMRRPARWAESRIESKLGEFLAGEEVWPPVEAFIESGYGPAYSQVLRQGGPERWAGRMSIRPPDRRAGVRAWNESNARESLQGFLRRRRAFPTQRQFTDAGYRGLYNWMRRNGGLDSWAEEFDLPRKRQRG